MDVEETLKATSSVAENGTEATLHIHSKRQMNMNHLLIKSSATKAA
jgi:hypothetical protein